MHDVETKGGLFGLRQYTKSKQAGSRKPGDHKTQYRRTQAKEESART